MQAHRENLFGLMAEFGEADKLLDATRRTHEAGYSRIDAYTPFPVEGLAEAMGSHKTFVPLFTLIGGLIGCAGGFFLQYWPNVIGYPLDIGGKPYDSWPAFIPITFEMTILFAALSCAIGMLALNGFPSPYHPVFNAPGFERATRDRFFLCIMAQDPKFDAEATKEFLLTLEPAEVSEVAS
jgi:Alternative complex III, ActD subunit